jgi:polyphosphate kinase
MAEIGRAGDDRDPATAGEAAPAKANRSKPLRVIGPGALDLATESQDHVGAGPLYFNRELSWLDFNARVLALAERHSEKLLERAKFLAITTSNLDEFFSIRVAGLKQQVEAGLASTSPDGATAADQLRAIRSRVVDHTARLAAVFEGQIRPELDAAGISLTMHDQLDDDDRQYLLTLFRETIFPVLTPLAVDPAHPFPYISNLSLNLAVTVRDPFTHQNQFARVKIPPLLPRFIALPDGRRHVPIEEVVGMFLGDLFPGMKIVSHHPFRVTRNADISVEEDEADDLLAAIETELRRRRRSADVVRLEVDQTMTRGVLDLLMRELDLGADDVYVVDGVLDLTALWVLHRMDRPELKDPPYTPATQTRLAAVAGDVPDLFRVMREGELLVHLPYESFPTSVEAFVDQAAADPNVLAIKQTLYRAGGGDSRIVRSLARAADAGKQVVVLVELKARGDEQINIAWAKMLEQAGAHVVYGLVGLKTHCKICQVVRQEDSGIRHYVHIGTGNYNAQTALVYEDVGLLSADPELGADVTDLFNFLTGYSRQTKYRRLLVAPVRLRSEILRLIRREARPGGYIVMKMNSLVDAEIIDALYEASRRGSRVDLMIRGMCCIRPGVPGLSETIRVRSIVGRYLEHSRIFRFGADDADCDYYIGSADMMQRNLDSRVEAMVPVLAPELRKRLAEILEVDFSDDQLAWDLHPDGSWSRVTSTTGVNAHDRLQELALSRAQGR